MLLWDKQKFECYRRLDSLECRLWDRGKHAENWLGSAPGINTCRGRESSRTEQREELGWDVVTANPLPSPQGAPKLEGLLRVLPIWGEGCGTLILCSIVTECGLLQGKGVTLREKANELRAGSWQSESFDPEGRAGQCHTVSTAYAGRRFDEIRKLL